MRWTSCVRVERMNRDEPLTPEERELSRLLGRRAEQLPAALDTAILAAARAVDSACRCSGLPEAPRTQHRPRWRGRVQHRRLDGVRHRHRLAAASGTADSGRWRRGFGTGCGRRQRLPIRPLATAQPTARWWQRILLLRPQHQAAPRAAPAPAIARASKPIPKQAAISVGPRHDRWLQMRRRCLRGPPAHHGSGAACATCATGTGRLPGTHRHRPSRRQRPGTESTRASAPAAMQPRSSGRGAGSGEITSMKREAPSRSAPGIMRRGAMRA